MSNDKRPSDELINAFVDDELAATERAHMLEQIHADEALRQQACELRMLKDMVRAGYREPPVSRTTKQLARPGWGWQAIAASLILVVGLGTGWMTRGVVADPLQAQMASLKGVQADPARLLLHVDSGDPEHFARLLGKTQAMLDEAKHEGHTLQVAVIVNSGGIDMLRAVTSRHAERIHALQAAYPNLSFIGCRTTLKRLREGGHDVRLLPGVEEAPAAIEAIVDRMKTGWTYIKA